MDAVLARLSSRKFILAVLSLLVFVRQSAKSALQAV